MRSGNVSGKTKLLINAFLILTIVTCLITMTNISLSISLSKNDAIVAKEDIKATTESTEEQADLTTEVVVTRGGAVVYNDDVVHEGEYLKYNIRVKNTTEEDIDNVVLVATIPEGVKYGELEADFTKIRDSYGYNFDENLREKIIEIGTVEAGQSKDLYYEVKVQDLQENEEEKDITTIINSFVGEELVHKFEMTNTVEPSDVQMFLGSYIERGGRQYVLNIASDTKEETVVKFHLPKEFKLKTVAKVKYKLQDGPQNYNPEITHFDYIDMGPGGNAEYVYRNSEYTQGEEGDLKGKVQNDIELETTEDNVVTAKLKTNYRYLLYGNIEYGEVERKDENGTIETIKAYAEIADSGTMSNESRMELVLRNVEVSMSSKNEGEKVKYKDEIEYELAIKNIGGIPVETDTEYNYVQVRLLDFIPEELKAISITYENWKVILSDNLMGVGLEKEEDKTIDISSKRFDEEGNKLADVDEYILIPKDETARVRIKAMADMVYEETKIENVVSVTAQNIPDKISNKVSHIILPYDYVDPENPVDPVDPVDPIDPVEPIEPVDPVDPSTPVTPTNPANPSNPGTSFGSNEQTGNGTCDFKIDKYISKVTVRTASGTKQYDYNDENLVKTEIKAKELNGATVTVDYKIVITNVGQVAGTVARVSDTLPSGFVITNESNKSWPRDAKGEYVNTSKSNLRIEPGESTTLNISATKQMTSETVGNFINEAEIRTAMSISGASEINSGNNSSSAELIIAVSTGEYVYIAIISIATLILIILAIYLIKKGKINIKKISKTAFVSIMFLVILIANNSTVKADSMNNAWHHRVETFYTHTGGGGLYIWNCTSSCVGTLPGGLFDWFHSTTFEKGKCENNSIVSSGGVYSWAKYDTDIQRHKIGDTTYSRRSIYNSK